MDKALNSYEYLKRISETYKEEKNLTNMLNAFRLISEDYNKLNNNSIQFDYSSYNFDECPKHEQEMFVDDNLRNVECLVTNSIYDKTGTLWNWYDIFTLLKNPDYALTEKIKRRVVYSTNSNNRPIGDVAYQVWNGLQIIDLDIKDEELASKLKPILFNELKKFNWFLGVCKSASGKGLHVWTKIVPIANEFKNRKIEYICNFRHKYSYVFVVLDKYGPELGYSQENIFEYMDMAMAKPQQGIFISSDNPLMNTNFINTRLDVNFEGAFECGVTSVDWISHPKLKQVFSKLEWFNNESFDKDTNIEIQNISGFQSYDLSKTKGSKHYKHAQRWQLANTLTNLYGEDEAFKIMCRICKETSTRELKGDVKTASIHHKPISIWAVKELNTQHGFKIEIKSNDLYAEETKKLDEKIKDKSSVTFDYVKEWSESTSNVTLTIKSNQFLSHIKDDIIANLSHITLLEAGAGYGKTEMIKSLKAKTLLILPFTSTIKAKVEASEVTKDWQYYYGSKKPQTIDLMGNQSMSMTIDKFSHLNIYELDASEFEYIVIDESHLLFTSSYRDVMGPCIQRLANCKAKVIMMTGTPTGEKIFFPNIKHIKVKKEDTRIKECQLHLLPTKSEQIWAMCESMANDIANGIRILFPTNSGITYYEEVVGIVQDRLNALGFNRKIRAFYYKKSNYGEQSMEDINRLSTVGNNDLICCSTYLSVGVDICDKSKFSIYFDKPWIPQDIEQFANRIRNNDLYVKIFLPKKDSQGNYINYYYTVPLDLSFDKKDLLFARDLIKTCNDMIERNQEESKYSPFIQNLISVNKYLKYDENDCKYYIDETTYKLRVFEERYTEWATQAEVMMQGIRDFGYNVLPTDDVNDELAEDKSLWLEEYMRACKNKRFNEITTQTRALLAQIHDGNIDEYRELLKGNYDIFKSNDPEMIKRRVEGELYTESIEILEKNIPIILSLYKYYDCDTIKEIYNYCTDIKTDKINFSKLQRIRQFANIHASIEKKRLDFPMLKFVNDARKWAKEHSTTTQVEILKDFLAKWAAKFCNSISGVVVEDQLYLETIYNLLIEFWKIIIIQSRPKKGGEITIKPFELLWENKKNLNNIYGNINTQTFFLEQLLDEIKPTDSNTTEQVTEEELPDLPHTIKFKLADVEDELGEVVHEGYNYIIYTSADKGDGSNMRFLIKQKNTNQLRDTLFNKIETKDDEIEKPSDNQLSLFDNELPF